MKEKKDAKIKGNRQKCAVCGAPATHLVWRAFDLGLVDRPDVCEKHYKVLRPKSESMVLVR
ncbi:MAG: hypothetical protein QW793_06220 [Candidatus Caldarchaeum sp.]